MTFIPEDFDASSWENIEPYVDDLIQRNLSCSSCLEKLISDSSNLAEHISETGALLYIGMTCDTENQTKKNDFKELNSTEMKAHIRNKLGGGDYRRKIEGKTSYLWYVPWQKKDQDDLKIQLVSKTLISIF